MPQSIIDKKLDFDEEIWIISILNLDTGQGLKKLFGHSTLLVEGMKKNIYTHSLELFVGQYDILASEDFIEQVRIFESNNYERDYKFQAVSFWVNAQKEAWPMILSIKQDAQDVRNGKKIPFEMTQLSMNSKSYNCTKWCLEKMAIANIDIAVKKLKPAVAAGGCRVV